MIDFKHKIFRLETNNTLYKFELLKSGHLRHLYYGDKANENDYPRGKDIGDTIRYEKGSDLFLEDELLEVSSVGKGDIKEPFVQITNSDGSLTNDFLYVSHTIDKTQPSLSDLPTSYGSDCHLILRLKDYRFNINLELHYFVYEKYDVITRYSRVVNYQKESIALNRLMSLQLDFINSNNSFTCFKGSWANEFHKVTSPINQIRLVNSSSVGSSSSRANPFVMISSCDASEDTGQVVGLNLVYSGNHYECVDTTIYNKSRFLTGINPDNFSFVLNHNDSFESPEAIMTYSNEGYNGMSKNMHEFIRNCIVRGEHKNKTRPILINTWEAFYFDLNEEKLIDLASKARQLGIELFVLDDGWFKARNDDTSSLGDWICDTKKIPNGLNNLSNKIGMQFGIWVEPEMVNTNSDLYHNHPEWCIEYPHHSEGRNQRYLDLSNPEVVDYLIEVMSDVFTTSDCSYVKWDLNRIMSDIYSKCQQSQTETIHRYYLGFYRLCKELNKRFPHVLFEGCSGGGNRFDLGILCYFSQIWASDNTDADVRRRMLHDYSYGYPQSVIGAHVSACPNHQTGNTYPLKYRYDVAKFGCFGYELDLNKLTEEELLEVQNQIIDFKENRELYQFGQLIRVDENNFKVVLDDKETEFKKSL